MHVFDQHGLGAGGPEPARAAFLDAEGSGRDLADGQGVQQRPELQRRDDAALSAALTAFLDEQSEIETEYGVADCSLFPADWIRILTGVDPAVAWRGRYSDEQGALAFVRECGGLIPTFASAAALANLRVTRRPKAGAVGVIARSNVNGGAVGAVCLGGGVWASRGDEGGVWSGRARFLKAWEVRA